MGLQFTGISVEMDKRVKFEIVLVKPQIPVNPVDKMVPSQVGCKLIETMMDEQRQGLYNVFTIQVYIKMKNLDHGTEYIWSKDKFFTRFDFMKELYRNHQLRNNGEEDVVDLRISEVFLLVFTLFLLVRCANSYTFLRYRIVTPLWNLLMR